MRLRQVVLSAIITAVPFVAVLVPFVAADWFLPELSFHESSQGSSSQQASYSQPFDPQSHQQERSNEVINERESVVEAVRSVVEHASIDETAHGPASDPEPEPPEADLVDEIPDLTEPDPMEPEPDEVEPTSADSDEPEAVCVLTDVDQLRFENSILLQEDGSWYIPRELVNFYALRVNKLKRLASTPTWRDENGEKAGFRVRPTECSIVLGAGFEANDVVLSINGRTVATVGAAVSAYFLMKDDPVFELEILRDGETLTQSYVLEAREVRRVVRRSDRIDQREDRREDRRNRRDMRRIDKLANQFAAY
jgi:hypothetical protein